MQDQANGGSEPTSNRGADTEVAQARGDSAPPPAPASDKPTPESEIARLRDQLLRTAADFDNFRKRSRREADDAQRRGRESAVKDLLPVFDDLERAAAYADGSADAKSVADGVKMVLRQFGSTLDRMGIKRVQTVGAPFDPAFHEAIQHMNSPDHPAGVILAEVQPGYTIGDNLLRAARVVVSKGPPSGDPMAS
jgi:molecular chaperone GrpE